jgi:hypothetical protein
MTATALCPGDLPLLLLPVRLEARFFTFTLPGNVTELRVRVYPDKIHLDSHEPDLLPGEHDWGAHYWEQDWRAGNDTNARAAAWQQLADRFGAERAAWIQRALRPTNPEQRQTAPVPADTPLPVAPALPPVTVVADGANSAWRHAPQARLLPDRWIALLQSGSTVTQVVGADIVRPLAVGPDPTLAPTAVPDNQLPIDPGMKWMIDFNEAEAKGMALRITVPPASLAAGLDRLLVFGVATSLTGAAAAAELATLLDAHHYTDGLEFLPFGTPTNNTDARRAAATKDDPLHQRSFAIEVAFDPATLAPQSNALCVGAALGLPTDVIPAVLGHIGQADDSHALDMRSMNVALWQIGWGYYLTNIVGFDGTGLTPSLIAWARDHFATHVRSGGPFPILRCGRQPYGLLPVTSLDLWQPGVSQQQALTPDLWLQSLLLKLRDNIWRARLGDVFRIGRRQTPSDPDADLADVMRSDGLSSAYITRAFFGRHYLQHLRAFLGEDLQGSGFIPTQDALAAGLLQRLGIAWRPRLARAIGAETAWPVTAPLVQAGEVSPWRNLEPNYIADLLALSRIEDVIAARPDPAATDGTAPLLQLLLRHALLREIADATAQIAAGAPGSDVTALLRDAELVDLVTDAPPTLTWKRQLDLPAPGIAGNPTIREFLEGLTSFETPAAVTALGDFRSSLAHLQTLDSERLQYLMQGTLDLSTHRLDAWITSFASKRLAAFSTTAGKGVYVGAYGWVENLRPAPPATAMSPLPAGEPGPLFAYPGDSGFIHAPSLTHAAAAALLRNAHLGASGAPPPDSPFAIDLSSRRLREAERLLDGIRQGQPLGALLGYRIERLLHDLGLDNFISPLRSLAPLAASPLATNAAASDTIAANNVVDGLALFGLWQSNRTSVLQRAPAGTTPGQLTALGGVLDGLGAAIDGLSDALTAEAAYQITRGNLSRIASTLSAVAQGDAPPPELDVAHPTRSGTPLTHRLLVLFSGAPVVNPGWPAAASSRRASAEPMVNAWASKLLGNADKVRCTIQRLDETGAVAETRKLTLGAIGVAPLDVVYGVDASTSPTQSNAALSDIEQQVLYVARHMAGGFDPAANLRLMHSRPGDLAAGETTLFDVLEQARAAGRLIAGLRGADPEDLNPPERTGASTIDLAELEARVAAAETALSAAHIELGALVASATKTAEALRGGLMALGAFGVGPAVPVISGGESAADVAALAVQATALMKTSAARLAQGTALRAQAATTDPRARAGQLADRMRAVFGPSFVVLPRFDCGAASTELADALAASKTAQGGDELAANGWFMQHARLREPLARLAACLRGAEVLSIGERLNLSVAQLPFITNERWVGLPPDPSNTLAVSKLSLVLQTTAPIDTAESLTGLVIDEWTEIVPSTTETTAIAFQFAPPDACAPQCLLLAVPPIPGADWTVDTLRQVLDETHDLAKLRAVDAEMLGETAQYLPALALAFNAKDDAVSTDVAPLIRA